MDERKQFVEIVRFAESNGYKDHLGMLPTLPINPSSAELLIEKVLWQRRFEIIFSHSFAKAFFGEEIICGYCGNKHKDFMCLYLEDDERCPLEEWQYYLQQMVLKKDPLKYLQQFMENNNE